MLKIGCVHPNLAPIREQTQGRNQRTAFNPLIFFENSGAGEGIRTLDPNLGKVVLYP